MKPNQKKKSVNKKERKLRIVWLTKIFGSGELAMTGGLALELPPSHRFNTKKKMKQKLQIWVQRRSNWESVFDYIKQSKKLGWLSMGTRVRLYFTVISKNPSRRPRKDQRSCESRVVEGNPFLWRLRFYWLSDAMGLVVNWL